MTSLHDAERRRREKEREALAAEHLRLKVLRSPANLKVEPRLAAWLDVQIEKLAAQLAACDRELSTLPK